MSEPVAVATVTLNPVNEEQLNDIFTYHAPDAVQLVQYAAVREAAKAFARTVIEHVPPSADRTAALRKVREAVMTANAAIALRGKNF